MLNVFFNTLQECDKLASIKSEGQIWNTIRDNLSNAHTKVK